MKSHESSTVVPEVRAIADRFIFDAANLKYMVAGRSERELESRVSATGWTVRQSAGHLAGAQRDMYVPLLAQWLRGVQPPSDIALHVDSINAGMADEFATATAAAIVQALDTSTADLLGQLEEIDQSRLGEAFGSWKMVDVLHGWSRHIQSHAPGIIDALPDLKDDPMVLNWILVVEFRNNVEAAAWQRTLAADARARLGMQGGDDGD